MAHIRKLDTGRWQVRYRDPAGKERARNFKRKVDAERFLHVNETAKLRGEWADPVFGRKSLAEWLEQVEAGKLNRRPATVARDDSVIRNLVLPGLGSMRLNTIRAETVRAWIGRLVKKGYAPATIRKAHQLLAGSLDQAVRDGLLPSSPARDVTLPRVGTHEMRFLDSGEVSRLAEAIAEPYRALVLTGAYTGLRFGELAGLEPNHLDLLRRSLGVEQSLAETKGGISVGPVKTAASRRRVSLPGFLVDELAAFLAAHPTDSLVFRAEKGGPLRRSNFRRRIWLPAVRASVGQPMRFHDLRHTHAALLIAQGEHPKVIQSRLGHASISTTLDRYGHLFEGLDEAAADRLDAMFLRTPADFPRTVASVASIARGS